MTLVPVGTMLVLLASGEQVAVPLYSIVGALGVHPSVWGGQCSTTGWTVSHRATGLALWKVLLQSDAIRIAQWLDQQNVLPEGRDEMLAWRSKLQPAAHTKLLADLHKMAPRFDPQETSAALRVQHALHR